MALASLHLAPLEVAAETFLLRSAHPVPGAPLLLPGNSLLIRAAEPILVDTGTLGDRDGWLGELRALVRPASVRWVVLSSDGGHHVGNLEPVLDLCPDATVLACWPAVLRMRGAVDVPPHRLRLLADGARLETGDRRFDILGLPAYGSPASRAVFDPVTGVLWTADLLAAPMPVRPVARVDELPPRMWAEGLAMLHHHALSPWLRAVDREAYAAQVRRLRALGASVLVGAHTPAITGAFTEVAFAQLAALPDAVAPPHPTSPAAAPAWRDPAATLAPHRPGTSTDEEGDGTRAHP